MTEKKTQKTGENKAKKPSDGTAAPKMVPVAAATNAMREEYSVGGAPRLEGVNVTIGGPGAEAYQEIIPGCEELLSGAEPKRRNRSKRVIISEPHGLNPEFSALTYLETMASVQGVRPEDLALQLITDSPAYRRHVRASWEAREGKGVE